MEIPEELPDSISVNQNVYEYEAVAHELNTGNQTTTMNISSSLHMEDDPSVDT